MNNIIMIKNKQVGKGRKWPSQNDFCLKETKTESEIEPASSNAPSV